MNRPQAAVTNQGTQALTAITGREGNGRREVVRHCGRDSQPSSDSGFLPAPHQWERDRLLLIVVFILPSYLARTHMIYFTRISLFSELYP